MAATRRCCAAAAAAALALGGCSGDLGQGGGDRTVSAAQVPFTFTVPAAFSRESIDELASRGDVLAAVGIDKVDVIAVRRIPPGTTVPRGDVRHRVLGHAVASRLHAFTAGGQRWGLECQWTPEHRADVLKACRQAIGSISRR